MREHLPDSVILEWAHRRLQGETLRKIGSETGRSRSQVHLLIQNRRKRKPELFREISEIEAARDKAEKQNVLRWSRFNQEEHMSFRQIEILEKIPNGHAIRRYRAAMKHWPHLNLPEPVRTHRKEFIPTETVVQIWHTYGRLRDWNLTAQAFGIPDGMYASRICKRRKARYPALFPPHPHDPLADTHKSTLRKAREIRKLIQQDHGWDAIAEAMDSPKRTCQSLYTRVRDRLGKPRDWPMPGRKDHHTADDAYRWAVAMTRGKSLVQVARENGVVPKTVKEGIRRAAKAHPSRFRQLGNIKQRQADAQWRERDAILKRLTILRKDHSWRTAGEILGTPPRTLRHWQNRQKGNPS